GRDSQAVGSGQGLRRAAQALGRRTHAGLARPLPKAGQGLGMPQSQGARLPLPCLHPAHAAKTMQSHIMFPDRLLDIENAAAHLHGMIDGRKTAPPSKRSRAARKAGKGLPALRANFVRWITGVIPRYTGLRFSLNALRPQGNRLKIRVTNGRRAESVVIL